MKRILGSLAAITLTATTSMSVIACSWNTPPISLETIQKVMIVAKEQVLNAGLDDGKIQTITGEAGKMTWPENNSKDEETNFRNWSDVITGNVATTLANKPTEGNDGGLINQSKNIISGDISADWEKQNISKESLALLQSYHMTVFIADLARVNDDSLDWFSQEVENHVKDYEINKKVTPIPDEQRTEDGSKVSDDGNYKIFNFLGIEASKWDMMKNHKGDYRVRFLVRVAPKNVDPVLFYLDKKMTK